MRASSEARWLQEAGHGPLLMHCVGASDLLEPARVEGLSAMSHVRVEAVEEAVDEPHVARAIPSGPGLPPAGSTPSSRWVSAARPSRGVGAALGGVGRAQARGGIWLGSKLLCLRACKGGVPIEPRGIGCA